MRTLWFPCKTAYPPEILCIDASFFAPGLKLVLHYDACRHVILAIYAKDL